MSEKKLESRVSIAHPAHVDRLKVGNESGKLYWDDKEIVARKTIDFQNIKTGWAVLAAVVAVMAGLGTLINGLVNLNKEICLLPIGTCNAKPPDPPRPPPPIKQKAFVVFFDWNRFDWEKSKLRTAAEETLQEVADYAKKNPKTKIHVIGHADSSGSAGNNMEIAARRANTVKEALSKLIPDKSITTSFEGAAEPLVLTNMGVDEAQNRRVEIVFSE